MVIRWGYGVGFPLWGTIIGLILFALLIGSIVWLVLVLSRPGRQVRMSCTAAATGLASATRPWTSSTSPTPVAR